MPGPRRARPPTPRRTCALLVLVLGFAGSASVAQPAANEAAPLDAAGTYLRPNSRSSSGAPVYLHVTPADMPWRIAIGAPAVPPRYGSREDARRVAVEAMQMWESAVQPRLAWFRLEFVEEDPSAPVQIVWKRRIAGPFGGFGGQRIARVDGRPRLAGEIQISTTPSLYTTLTVDEVRRIVAHEFGHVLGLGHCLECDSAMNYAWHTRQRVLVTEVDVRTFLALVAQPTPLAP